MLQFDKGTLLEDMMGKARYIVDESGQKTAVVLPVEEYEDLLEDIHDLAVIAERKDESTISFDEIIKRLEADVLL
jgi:PHD/YefM family antitoxin component YafN of YafNO toxin-antitoxin module